LRSSPPAACGALATLGQDARIYASLLDKGLAVRHEIAPGRAAWLQMINGAVSADGIALSPGDGLAVQAAGAITLTASEDSEFLLFDLA
jgi:redox-sensitive bicupin YhaK (pirin superfamily)